MMVRAKNGDILSVQECNVDKFCHHPSSAYWLSWEGEHEIFDKEWDKYGLCVYASFYNGNLSDYDLIEYKVYEKGYGKWLKFAEPLIVIPKRINNPILSLNINEILLDF